jgi:hypothetical protein
MELHRVQPVHLERHGMAYGRTAMIAFQIGTVRLELNACGALRPLSLSGAHRRALPVKQERTTIIPPLTRHIVQPALLGHTR